jgi:hypothetical protein
MRDQLISATGRRRRLLCIGLGALGTIAASLAPSAAASPWIGEVRDATGTVRVLGADGHLYRIGFELQTAIPAGGPATSEVSVSVTRCSSSSCIGTGLSYLRSLPSGAVSYDGFSATVETVLSGAPLTLQWAVHDSNPVFVPGAQVADGGNNAGVNTGPNSGTLRASIWRMTCTGQGESSDYEMASATPPSAPNGAAAPARVPGSFAPRRGHHSTCQPLSQ